MPRVLVAGKIHPDGLSLLRSTANIEIDYVEEVSASAFEPRLPQADALLIRTQPLSAAAIAGADRLRIVSRHGVGYDSVDVEALNGRRIPLAVVGDVNSRAVAEHTMMLILAAARRTLLFDHKLRNGEWDYRNSLDSTELDGRSLLIVGYGRIGRHLGRLAAAFNMRITVFDPFLPPHAIEQYGVLAAESLEAALAEADIVSFHIPKTDNCPVLSAQRLVQLKPGAIVVNTARGGLVDEAALNEAIETGRVSAAGLDVFEVEPPAPDNPLLGNGRVILSPHNAGLTEACAARMAFASAKNVIDYFDGRLDPALVVNRDEIRFVPAPDHV